MRKEKSMSIDFEQDQREELDGANDAKKLSDQVVKITRVRSRTFSKRARAQRSKKKSRISII